MLSRRLLILNILRGFRALQKRNRAVLFASGYKFTLLESHLLTEIDSRGKVSPAELSLRLQIPKQEVSRLSRRFIQQGAIVPTATERGKGKYLSLSPIGQAIVDEVDAKANPRLVEIFSVLTVKEQLAFKKMMESISDSLVIPSSSPRPTEPPLRAEIRRITRALTLLKGKIFNSSLHPLEWHILSELQEGTASGLSVTMIAESLNLKLATVSASILNLSTRGLIDFTTSLADKRVRDYAITRKGLRVLKQTEDMGVLLITTGLEPFTLKDLKNFCSLMERVITKTSNNITQVSMRVLN